MTYCGGTMNTEPTGAHQQVLRQLLERTRLRQDELAAYLSNAVAPAYWGQLNPQLGTDGKGTAVCMEATPIEPRQHGEFVRKVAVEGYFQTEPVLSAPALERMRSCLESLRREGWPPVFGFVYDEFWLAARTPSLVRLLSAVLGAGYRQIPHVWTHYVHPTKWAGGWPPHVDGPRRPNRLNVWLPLTDATLDNGCMYLIPRDRTPPVARDFSRVEAVDRADLKALLHNARALPARAGAVLGWAFDVIHWGSRCDGPGEPRISISQEFIADGESPGSDELPLLEAQPGLPTFAQRLHAIGKGIVEYERFEPAMIRFVELARRLVERARPEAAGT
jgi:hypothetical protein